MGKNKPAKTPALTRAEEEIMHYIWKLGSCMVADIRERLGKNPPPHSTISSIVRILEKKGYVGHKAYGRTYEYFPLITKNRYMQHRVKKLVSDYFGGSPDALVSFLVRERDLSLEDLQALIDQLDKSSSPVQ